MRPEDIDKNNISEQDEPSTNEAQETSSPANEGNEINEEHSEYKIPDKSSDRMFFIDFISFICWRRCFLGK